MGQAKTLHTHMVIWAVTHSLPLTAIQRGIEAEVSIDQLPFLSPSQQHENTQGINDSGSIFKEKCQHICLSTERTLLIMFR